MTLIFSKSTFFTHFRKKLVIYFARSFISRESRLEYKLLLFFLFQNLNVSVRCFKAVSVQNNSSLAIQHPFYQPQIVESCAH